MTEQTKTLEELIRERARLDHELARHQQLVTVLFVDIVGSTRFYDRHGDIAGLAMVQGFLDTLSPVIREHGGAVVKTIGDAILARFQRAEQAVRCALDLQWTLVVSDTGNATGEPLQIRIALNSGPALLKDDDVFGDVVNVASRIEGAARAGDILISPSVYDQLRSVEGIAVRLRSEGVALKGKSAKLDLYEVLWRYGEPVVPQPPRPSVEQLEMATGLSSPAPTGTIEASQQSRDAGKTKTRRKIRFAGAAAGILLLAVLAAVLAGLVPQWRLDLRHPAIHAIAVLPLANLSGDPKQEYLAEGIHEALIAELSRISSLKVISRSSTLRYKSGDKPLPEVARELNVEGLIEGSVIREGKTLRITVQLIYGPNDRHLWAQSFDREVGSILSLQSEIARTIADQIRAKLTPQERLRLTTARSVNPEAYELYLKGRHHWNKRTANDLLQAVEYFRAATTVDPTSALAYAGLADCYALYSFYGISAPQDSFPLAQAAAQKALEFDNTLIEAHTTLAFVTFYYGWDWAAAKTQLARVLELSPESPIARQWYAEYLVAMGQHQAALVEIRRAQNSDPLSPLLQTMEGYVEYYARRNHQVVEASKKALTLDPSYSLAYAQLGRAYAETGDYTHATEALQKADKLSGGTIGYSLENARVYALAGRGSDARRILDRILSDRPETQRRYPALVAAVYAALREKEKAAAWMDKAYQERDVFLVRAKVDPRFDFMRSDPRVQEIIHNMHFPD